MEQQFLVSIAAGVETTRHFLLGWLSYTCRYVPVGLLDSSQMLLTKQKMANTCPLICIRPSKSVYHVSSFTLFELFLIW